MDFFDCIVLIINIIWFCVNMFLYIGHICSLFKNKSNLYEIDYALKEAELITKYPSYYAEYFSEVEENEKQKTN